MKKRYGALRFISGLYKFCSWLVFLFSIIGAAGVLISSSNYPYYRPDILGALSVALSGMLMATGLLAFGQLINLLIDMETNSRTTAIAMQRMARNSSGRKQQNEFDDSAFD
jgi:hypothetical protein